MANDKSDKETALTKAEQVASSSPIIETILNIFKAALATAPFCGGIASLITDYIPSARFRRLEEFAQKVADDLSRLSSRVDQSYIKSDDFAFIFEKSFRGVAENPQQEKINAFRGILVNSAIRKDYSEEEKEYFLNLVSTLSVLHIRILRFMAFPKEYLRDSNIPENRIQGGFSDFFPVVISGVEISIIISAFEDLYQSGLINTEKHIFNTMTSAQGLHLLGNRVSDSGRRFIQFCVTPKN